MELTPDDLERMMQREIARLADEFQGTFSKEMVERSARLVTVSTKVAATLP